MKDQWPGWLSKRPYHTHHTYTRVLPYCLMLLPNVCISSAFATLGIKDDALFTRIAKVLIGLDANAPTTSPNATRIWKLTPDQFTSFVWGFATIALDNGTCRHCVRRMGTQVEKHIEGVSASQCAAIAWGFAVFDLHAVPTFIALGDRINNIIAQHPDILTGDDYAKLIMSFSSLIPGAHPAAEGYLSQWINHLSSRTSVLQSMDALTILSTTLLGHVAGSKLPTKKQQLPLALQQTLLTIAAQQPLPTRQASDTLAAIQRHIKSTKS